MGGGGRSNAPPAGGGKSKGAAGRGLTREKMAAEKRATRCSKALVEMILKHPVTFPNEFTCQVKVRPKVKIGGFHVTSNLSVVGQNLLQILLKNRGR